MTTSKSTIADLSNSLRQLEERLRTEQAEGTDTRETLAALANVREGIKSLSYTGNSKQWNV